MQNGDGQFDENMSRMKSGLKALYGSKVGKILPVLVIAGLVATASASVFVLYYGSATATVGTNDIALAAGSDSTACTTNFPCITVTPSSPIADTATIAMNLGTDTATSPQPETYFTDAMHIVNSGPNTRTINSITVSSIGSTHPADFGSITVYYCTSQSDTPATSCAGSFAITSTTGGTVSGGAQTIASAGTGYIEIVGFAGSGATGGDTITFNVQISWA